jgi:hypothetical protein
MWRCSSAFGKRSINEHCSGEQCFEAKWPDDIAGKQQNYALKKQKYTPCA